MPGRHGLRPLKAWRYVGVYGPELDHAVSTFVTDVANRLISVEVLDLRTLVVAEAAQ